MGITKEKPIKRRKVMSFGEIDAMGNTCYKCGRLISNHARGFDCGPGTYQPPIQRAENRHKVYRIPPSEDGFRPEIFVAGKLEGVNLDRAGYYESSQGGEILDTSSPILGPLTEEQVIALGGILVNI